MKWLMSGELNSYLLCWYAIHCQIDERHVIDHPVYPTFVLSVTWMSFARIGNLMVGVTIPGSLNLLWNSISGES